MLRDLDYSEECQKQLDELGLKHHVETDPVGRSFLHLDYTIFANKTSEIVKECRGLALHVDSWSVYRNGFRRFMNYGETGCDPFDFKTPVEYEDKKDGSLIFFHFDHSTGWVVGTRGKIFPTDLIQGYDITFPQLFWNIMTEKYDYQKFDKTLCYLFEICSPINRVVIKHSTADIFFTGARKIDDWSELKSEELDLEALRLGLKRPATFTFKSINECLEHAKTMDGGAQEGFVLKQWNELEKRYNRAKIKSTSYLALHQITSARSLSNLVKLALIGNRAILNDFEEFLPAYDKIDAILIEYKNDCEECFQKAFAVYDDLSSGKDFRQRRKEFAAMTASTPYASYCFGKLDKRFSTPDEFLSGNATNSGIKRIIEMFDLQKVVGTGWVIVDDVDEDV